MKINLGCGNDIRIGYVNIDKKKTHPTVIVDDFMVLGGMPANSAEEVIATNILGQIPLDKLLQTIKLWASKLKPGGRLYIESLDSNILGNLLSFDNINMNDANKMLYGEGEDKNVALYNLTILNDAIINEKFSIKQKGYNGTNFYVDAIKNV